MCAEVNFNTGSLEDFGHGDAYKDSRLLECFLNTPIYEKSKSGKTFILEGLKGSGKSAVFRYIDSMKDQNTNYFTILLSEKDYQKTNIGGLSAVGSDYKTYERVWRSKLLLELIYEVWLHRKELKGTGNIEGFITKHSQLKQDIMSRFRRWVARIEKAEAPSIPIPLVGELGGGAIELTPDTASFMEKVESLCLDLKNVLKGKKVFLMVDGTDNLLDDADPDYDLISALIDASQGLENDFSINMKEFVIILSIRSDILSQVAMNNHRIANLGDSISEIKWNIRSLKRLITDRIVRPLKLSLTIDEAWDLVFPLAVGNKAEPSFNYIFARTFSCPRDLIRLCNQALNIAKESGHHRIMPEDVLAGERNYSQKKYEEISGEYKHRYGKEISKIVLDPFENSASPIGNVDFGHILISKIINGPYRGKRDWLTPETDRDEIIKIMVDIGVLGVQKGNEFVYSYENPNVELDAKFYQIHKAFHAKLKIREV